MKSQLLLDTISSTYVGKTMNGFLWFMVCFSTVKLVRRALSCVLQKSLTITGA